MKKLRPIRYRDLPDPDDFGHHLRLPERLKLPRKEFLALSPDYRHPTRKPTKGERAAARKLAKLRQARYVVPTARPDITAEWWHERKQQVLAEEGCCRWCGATTNLTVDHIMPCAAGGTHHRNNLQVLCDSCNQAKGSSTFFSCPAK